MDLFATIGPSVFEGKPRRSASLRRRALNGAAIGVLLVVIGVALGCAGRQQVSRASAPQTITPVLRVADVATAVAYYERVFGAKQLLVLHNPDGSVEHAELLLNNSIVWVDQSVREPKTLGGTSGGLIVTTPSADKLVARVEASGSQEADGAWTDPFGHVWWIRQGRAALEPVLIVDSNRPVGFYSQAFGAEDSNPSVLRFDEATVQLAESKRSPRLDTPTRLGGAPFRVHLYVADCNVAHQRATDNGARSLVKPTVMFWGDRWALIEDPSGHTWGGGTRLETLTQTEMQERMEASRAAR